MYSACMPSVQIREVPDDVHEALVRKAAQAGQSLQHYLYGQLVTIATTPTVDDVIARIERRAKGRLTRKGAIDQLAAERAGR